MKSIYKSLPFLLLMAIYTIGFTQSIPTYDCENWLKKAEDAKPKLTETLLRPVSIVNMVQDQASFQGWKAEPVSAPDALYKTSFKKIKNITLDFGNHYTGYFTFKLGVLSGTPDGPVRLKFTFGEVPAELCVPFDPYNGGISRAWLQDEIIMAMNIPATITLERRIACRYVKIELLASSPYFDFNISDLQFKAVTSVSRMPEPLANSADQIIKDIDRVGLNTLKECMQTVYEDGPKRDQRLWIGDLYLESLANSYSFKNFELTKRCLYLLAGLSGQEGYLVGTVFEAPEPHAQAGQYLYDYCLLYNVALKEYLIASNDRQTARELWPVAKRQLDIIYKYLQPDGLVNYEKANAEWWLFFDWKEGLHKEAALQGLSIFALRQTYELARLLNKEQELKEVPALVKKMSEAARKQLYNKTTRLFESGKDKQVSYASQIWMILGGVLDKEESQKTLTALVYNDKAVAQGAPYLYHYFMQALVNAEMNKEAKHYLTQYWGGMVRKGADTFWEVYDPNNELLSPYGFYPVNSYCHAWSCTPVYFIRKYPQIFQ
ncbi:MAG: glycoside hydrolase [Bacteroidales bacterium]